MRQQLFGLLAIALLVTAQGIMVPLGSAQTPEAESKTHPARILESDHDQAQAVRDLKAMGELPGVKIGDLDTAAIDLDDYKDQLAHSHICGCPHKYDPEIANSTPSDLSRDLWKTKSDCADLIENMKRLGKLEAKAEGHGSIPAGCHPDYEENHVFTYMVDRSSFPAHYKQSITQTHLDAVSGCLEVLDISMDQARERFLGETMLDVVIILVNEDVRRLGCLRLEVDAPIHGIPHTLIEATFQPGSQIGVAQFNDETCGERGWLRLDSSYRPGINGFATLLAHEWGHRDNMYHEFSGQNRHRSIMSYSPWSEYLGFTGRPDTDKSHPKYVRSYGGEPVPVDGEEPPPTGTGGTVTYKVGDEVVQTIGDTKITFRVVSVGGGEGQTFADKVEAEFLRIPNYARKEKHRQTVADIYDGMAQAAGTGRATVAEIVESWQTVRSLFLGRDGDKWDALFALADTVETKEGLSSVSDGLRQVGAFAVLEWTAKDYVDLQIATNAMFKDKALSPQLIMIFELIIQFLPPQAKLIFGIVLQILKGLPSEEPSEVPEPPEGSSQSGHSLHGTGGESRLVYFPVESKDGRVTATFLVGLLAL